MSVVLALRQVSKRFGSQQAVAGVSLSVQRGSLYALLGPSGCGKTTTLRMIAGFEQPDTGDILLNGSPIQHLRPYQRPVSTVFQNYALFPHLTARSNIEFGLKRRGIEPHVMARKVTDVLEMLQLTARADRYPSELSGGEKQRVALARSLVVEPEVLLLDEPLSALDPNLRKQVRVELKALQKRVGTTFVFVTHDQEEALSMSDCVAVMNNGSVEQAGTPEDLYVHPKSRFVASFLGSVNWIKGVGVRPELTRISRSAPADGAKSESGVVRMSTFLGSHVHVHATLTTGEMITAEVPRADADFQPGENIHVWWRSADELSEWPT